MADIDPLALVGLALFGLAVGSFLNVVIVRLPDGGSLLSPPSRCPQCEAEIRPRDNIPVLSWVLLRGRCRDCGEPIPLAYPLVEVANAVLWVAAGLRFGLDWPLVPFLVLFSALLAQSVIDLELYLLLNKITYPVWAGSVVLIGLVSAVEGEPERLLVALVGSVGYALVLFIPALVYPRGMGLGDVKLVGLLGLFLGWIHPVLCLAALVAGCLLGMVVGLVLLVARGGRSSQFPFGPWLALGAVLTILFSDVVFDLYDDAFVPPAFLALVGG